jgi:hypothetical protein
MDYDMNMDGGDSGPGISIRKVIFITLFAAVDF